MGHGTPLSCGSTASLFAAPCAGTTGERSLWRCSMRGLSVLALLLVLLRAAPGAAQVFKSFELGDAPGTVCPGATGSACTNGAAEPAIRAAADGTLYASSEVGLGAGTDAWKSSDGGLHYTTLASPNQTSNG